MYYTKSLYFSATSSCVAMRSQKGGDVDEEMCIAV
jgi:hypothetical protein